MPLPDQITLELEAIDAALAGEAVDPEFAELAELALLLADSRPELTDAAVTRLDLRVSGLASDTTTRRRVARDRARAGRPRRSWIFRPAFGAGLAAVAGVIVVVVLVSRGGSSASYNSAVPAGATHPTAAATSAAQAPMHTKAAAGSSAAAASGGTGSRTKSAPTPGGSSSSSQGSAFDPSLKNLSAPAAPSSAATVPTPAANGQKIVQSSQLSLTAPSDRINQVSQELFDVVGAEQGLVKHSSVTAGAGGYASFTLSIPTGNLSATLSRLASLKYSRVTSSTESTTDVTDTYQDDQRKLADAKALHTALLKQLADAYTSSQIDSLDAQIKDNEATIGADEATLNSLASQISYTSVSVQINAGNITSPHTGSGAGGFTLHTAGHDALRVLVIVAGVALIVLAVLVPLGLVLGLLTWVRVSWRRRRRESALDAA